MSLPRKIVLLLVITLPFLLSVEKVSSPTPSEHYLYYHQNILTIDSMNASLDFDGALQKYHQLFSKYQRVMVKDAFNACQIAALMKHSDFKYFFVKCGETGIPLNTLLRHPLINKGYSSDSVQLKSLFQQGKNAYMQRIDLPLQQEMLLRYQREQKAKGSADYSKVCQENFYRILKLSEQNRFPGEALIGIDENMENIVVPTLCHYPYAYKQMEQYLNKAVKEGSLSPGMAIYIYGFSQTRKSVLYTDAIPIDTSSFTLCYNLPFGKHSSDIPTVDRNRASQWIPSVSIQNRIKAELPKRGIQYQFGF